MSDFEMKQRGIDELTMNQMYKKAGINTYRKVSIHDDDEIEFSQNLFEAAQVLDDLINRQNHIVYIHCGSGLVRAPTLAAFYICLYVKSKNYDRVEEVEKMIVKRLDGVAVVNTEAVNRSIATYLRVQTEILDKIRAIEYERERKEREERDKIEAEKRRLERIAREEEERLRREREAYLKAEQEKKRRLEEEERQRKLREEQALLDKWRKEEQERQRLMKLAMEAENRLLEEYDRLEAEEAERLRLLKLREAESTVFEHFVSGQVDYSGVSEQQLNELSKQLFS